MSTYTPFPITSTQRERGHLNSEGAENIALLQDLNTTTTPKTMYANLDHSGSDRLDFCGILASALTDDDIFTQLYPDALMRSPNATITGEGLPGLRQNSDGDWQRIAPDDATLDERREYVRRHLIVGAAKKILGYMSRPITDHIAVTEPRNLQAAFLLTGIATDVCKRFDPSFLANLSGPSLNDAMQATLGVAST